LPALQTAFVGLGAIGTVGTLIFFGRQLRETRSERYEERERRSARLVASTFPTVAPPSGNCVGEIYYAGGEEPALDVSVLVIIQERHWHADCGDIASTKPTFTYSAVFCQLTHAATFPIPSNLTSETDDAVIAISWSDRYGHRHWWARRYRGEPQPSNSRGDYWKPLDSPQRDSFRDQHTTRMTKSRVQRLWRDTLWQGRYKRRRES
jgi:hypothetical protein